MKVEGNFCGIDELSLGFHMSYGEDEIGSFHMVSIGLLIFEVSIIRYLSGNVTNNHE